MEIGFIGLGNMGKHPSHKSHLLLTKCGCSIMPKAFKIKASKNSPIDSYRKLI